MINTVMTAVEKCPTGNPKGIVHSHAGYLLYASTTHKDLIVSGLDSNFRLQAIQCLKINQLYAARTAIRLLLLY